MGVFFFFKNLGLRFFWSRGGVLEVFFFFLKGVCERSNIPYY